MSYGLVGDNTDTYGPTIQGMKLLRETVIASRKNYPTLLRFVKTGATVNTQQLSIECNNMAKTADNEDVKSTLLQLAKAAESSKENLALC